MRIPLFALVVFCAQAFPHAGETDGIGCHVQKSNGTYHCHAGPLKGRAFVNKAAAVHAMMALEKAEEGEKPVPVVKEEAPVPATPTPTAVPKIEFKLSELEPIKVIAWNAKLMGKEPFDHRQVASLIAIADIVVFQEVNVGFYGRDGIGKIAAALSTSMGGEKICKAVTTSPAGAKSRFGFIWKDRKVAILKANGIVKEACDVNTEITVALTAQILGKTKREVPVANFFVRHANQFISIAPVVEVADSDLPSLFTQFAGNQWPTLVVGDLNRETSNPAFVTARAQKFQPIFTEFKTGLRSTERGFVRTYDNIWVRGLGAAESRIIDLAADFPDVDIETIRTAFSNRCPFYSEFIFPIDDDQPKNNKRIPTSEDEETP